MLFNTLQFWGFFLAFFAAYHLVARTRVQRMLFILIGSCLFYSAWDYRFVPLLLGTALLDFYIARAIARDSTPPRRRTRLLAASFTLNLGVLGLFKYLDFAVGSVCDALRWLHLSTAPAPVFALVLPIGISFYTFQSMSYTFDVYRGHLPARQEPLEFLSAVTFFPHLIAGPIIRASTILPQLDEMPALQWKSVERAAALIGVGLFNKAAADLLGRTVDHVFTETTHTTLTAWTGALAFTAQVYGDFAGYSDIAIGVALLLGFELPLNFNLPYLSSSPVDFWNRWHISFSTWLRDYLYVPLGWKHRYRNLLITMVLGGLWHGASWTFVAWGAYHGVLLVITRFLAARSREKALVRTGRWVGVARIALTLYLVVLGWVLFRATSFTAAWQLIRDMHGAGGRSVWDRATTVSFVLAVIGLLGGHLSSYLVRAERSLLRRPLLLWPAAALFIAFAVSLSSERPFIYFQF